MAISSSEIAVIPKRFSGIRVLLIEPEHTSLVQHAYMLSQNSYRVTSTTKASTGLTMVQNGHLYDCVLVDVDIHEMDMVDFIHQVLKRKPELSIIIMVSDDSHLMRFVNEALKNEAILCLVKPCDLSDICNIWNHVCRKRIASEKHDSKGKSLQASNIINRVDPIFKKFPTLNRAMFNNETSQEYGAMFNPIYMNSFGNEDGTGTIRNTEKGKQPMDNDQPLEGDTYDKKRNNKPRINWTKALHGKFLEALNTLGKQNAIPSEILKYMNVPGLTRNHVASHLQKLIGGERISKRPRIVPVVEIGDSLQPGSYASKTSGQLNLSSYHGSIIQTNSLQIPSRSLNSAGLSYMSLANIKARMQESPLSIPNPRTATTTMSNFGGDQVTDHSSRDTFPLSMSDPTSVISSPTLGLVQNFGSTEAVLLLAQSGVGATVAPDNPTGLFGATNLSSGFDNGNSGGGIAAQTPFSFHGGDLLGGESCGLFGTENGNLGGSSVTEHPFAVSFSFDNLNDSRGAISSGVSEPLAPSFCSGNSGGGGGFGTQVLTPLRYDSYDSSLDDASEPLAEFDCFGIPIEPWPVTEMGSEADHGLGDPLEPLVGLDDEENCNDTGARETAILSPITDSQTQTDGTGDETSVTNDQSWEDLALHEFVSHELGGLCDHPQDFQGNGQDLFMGFLDDSATQPQIPPPVNSNVVSCLGGGVEEAATTVIDDDPLIVHMAQFDVESTMQLLDEVDSGGLIN